VREIGGSHPWGTDTKAKLHHSSPRAFCKPWYDVSSDKRPASHLGQGTPGDASVAYGSHS